MLPTTFKVIEQSFPYPNPWESTMTFTVKLSQLSCLEKDTCIAEERAQYLQRQGMQSQTSKFKGRISLTANGQNFNTSKLVRTANIKSKTVKQK